MRQIIELARGCPFSGSSTIDELKTGDVTAGLRPTDSQPQPNSTPHVSPLVAPTLNSCHAPQKGILPTCSVKKRKRLELCSFVQSKLLGPARNGQEGTPRTNPNDGGKFEEVRIVVRPRLTRDEHARS